MNREDKIQLNQLQIRLNNTVDNLERAIIISDIEKIKNKYKESDYKSIMDKTKINSATEAPAVMDRKNKVESYNGHDFTGKAVNGVYEKEVSRVIW